MGQKKSSGAAALVGVALLVVVAAVAGYYMSASWNRDSGPRPAPDPALAAAIDVLLAAWDRVDAVSAEVETERNAALGRRGLTRGTGTYELLRENGIVRIRFGLRNSLRILKEGETNKSTLATESLRWIADGDVLYHSSAQPKWGPEEGTNRIAYKEEYDPRNVLQIGGRPLFELLRKDFELKVLPDAELDGKAVAVLEGTPRNGDWRSLHYFDRETGIRLQMTEEEADGETSTRITLKNLDLSPEFEPDHFVLRLPEGVEIEDRTHQAP